MKAVSMIKVTIPQVIMTRIGPLSPWMLSLFEVIPYSTAFSEIFDIIYMCMKCICNSNKRKNNNQYLLTIHSVPGIVLSTLHVLSCLTFTTTK